jgi:hypothetical protein
MSKLIEESIKYVEQSKVSLLITVDENKVPFVRPKEHFLMMVQIYTF